MSWPDAISNVAGYACTAIVMVAILVFFYRMATR